MADNYPQRLMADNYPQMNIWTGSIDPNAGRFGDTFVRNVGGVPSHVNPIEAEWIDTLGPLGESLTMAAGSGTTNPKDGAPEYSFSALLGLIPVGYEMWKNYDTRNDEPNLTEAMSGWKGEIDQLNTRADELMDPGSAYNQSMINNLKKNNFDQLAFTNQMGNRNAAQGGVSNYSGIQNQVTQANMDRMQQINQQATDKLLQTNLDRGINLQGNVTDQMKAYSQPFAQQEINQFAGGGMLDSAMSGGGMKGILGALMSLGLGSGDGGGEGVDAYGDPVSFEGDGGGGGGLGGLLSGFGDWFMGGGFGVAAY